MSPSNPTANNAPWFYRMIVFVLFLGGLFRAAYIDHETFNPDEPVAQAVIQNLDFPNKWDTNWAKTEVLEGWRYNQYNFSSYHYLLYFWKCSLFLIGLGSESSLGPLRALNVVLGLIYIGAIALAARKLAGEFAGIAAAAAAAISPLLIQDAHYLRCESMLTAGIAILLWLITWRNPKPRWLLMAGGFIAGWMVACKATMILSLPLLLPVLIPTVTLNRENRKLFYYPIGLVGLGFIMGVFIGVPWGVLQPSLYFSGLSRLAAEYSISMPPFTKQDMSPSFQVALAYMQDTLGWSFGVTAAVGLVGIMQFSGWMRTVALVTPLFGAFAIFGGHAFFAERSYSPFFPIITVLFGAGAQYLTNVLTRRNMALIKYRVCLQVILFTVTLALPTIYSWQIVMQGFSGREQLEKDAALIRMKGNVSGRKLIMYSNGSYAKYYREIVAAIENCEPMLIVLVDYYGDITPPCLAILQENFHGQVLGVRESLFPDLPPCTLHTNLSPRLWLLYIPAR